MIQSSSNAATLAGAGHKSLMQSATNGKRVNQGAIEMAYQNEIPTRKTFSTLGSSYTYEQVVSVIEQANAINAEYETVCEDVYRRMYATFSTDDFIFMSDAERKTEGALCAIVNSGADSVYAKGAIGRGSNEFWPVARIESDIKRMRTQIKKVQKFGGAF